MTGAKGVCMNRVLSSLAATFLTVANVAAAPVPNDQQANDQQAKQTPIKTLPKKAPKPSHPSRDGKASGTEPKPHPEGIASVYGKQFHGRPPSHPLTFAISHP